MELIDLYDSKRNNLNKTWERQSEVEPPKGEYKLNVHTWIINDNNAGGMSSTLTPENEAYDSIGLQLSMH